MMVISGGLVRPVSSGEMARINQPLGAIRNAIPKATETCGTDSNGDSSRCMRLNQCVPCQAAQNNVTMVSEITVAPNPVLTDNQTDRPIPGLPNNSRQGARETLSPPKAGR